MEIFFSLSDIILQLPKVIDDNSGSDSYYMDKTIQPYYLIGFNQDVENSKLLRIPYTTSNKNTYCLNGNMSNTVFACIMIYLYLCFI